MELREGYKQTEVGVIPEDWDVETIKIICSEPMQNGVFYAPSNKGWGIKLINVGDLYKSTPIDIESLELFNANVDEQNRFRVINGDIFFTRSSIVPDGIAHCNIYQNDKDDAVVFDSHVIRVRPNHKKIYPLYFYKYSLSRIARSYLIAHSKTATMTTIDQGALGKCPVLVPPYKEQTAIANALSDTDALIQSLARLIAKKRQIKQGAMQTLLNPYKNGRLKTGWVVKKLGDFLNYEQPTDYLVADTGYNDNNKTPVLTAGKTFVLGYTHEEFGIFYSDLPVIIFDDFTTASKFVDFPFKAKSSAMKILKRKNEKVNLRFIYELLQKIDYPLGDHKRHWIGEFQYLDVCVPDDEAEQTAIATILSDMDADISALETKLAKTRQIKQGMMQNLLTGRIRLVKPKEKIRKNT